jgi:hypothetical protein
MARAGKLKVYRTPIGFHDAYVAATSQKAALEAWGSDADLFARGVAEQVEDAALGAEPRANPGKVIRRLRGTAAEQIAEASKTSSEHPKTKQRAKAEAEPKPPAKHKRPKKPKPRPNRAKLNAAEDAVAQAEAAWRIEDKRIAGDIAALTRKREAARARADKEIARLERTRASAETAYKRALAKWQQE